MKNVIVALGIFCIVIPSFGQVEGEIRAKLGNEYGIGTNLYGMSLSGEYFILNNLSGNVGVTALFPESGKASSYDLDAKYYFIQGRSQLYGLIGFQYYRRRLEFALPEEDLIHSPGLNIGGGYMFRISEEFSLNSEIKFQPQNQNNLLISIGVIYHIN